MAGWETDEIEAATHKEISANAFRQALREGGGPAVSSVDPLLLPDASDEITALRRLRERLGAFAARVETHREEVLASLRVLLGSATISNVSHIYGAAAQFELKGAARDRRVAYLRGLYNGATRTVSDVLTLLAGDDNEPIEDQDP